MSIEENIAKVKAITPRKTKNSKAVSNPIVVEHTADSAESVSSTVNTMTSKSCQWHVVLETAQENYIIGVTADYEEEAIFLGQEALEYARPDLYTKVHNIKAIKL